MSDLVMKRPSRPALWKISSSGIYWTKTTKACTWYMCRFCGRTAKGLDSKDTSHNHVQGCKFR